MTGPSDNVGTPAAAAAAESFLVRDRLPVDLTHRPDPDQSSVHPFVIPDQLSPTAMRVMLIRGYRHLSYGSMLAQTINSGEWSGFKIKRFQTSQRTTFYIILLTSFC